MSGPVDIANVAETSSPPWRSMVADVCLVLLVGCCLCASLAASLI